jgi:hypothetical protein
MLGYPVVLNAKIGLWKIGQMLFGLMRLLLFYFIDTENTESVYARYSHCWSFKSLVIYRKVLFTVYAF